MKAVRTLENIWKAAMEAVILVGVQGAGKSTFYRERFFDTHVRINLDMLGTRKREQLLLAACLDAGQSFVVDNTNPQASDRARYIAMARAKGFRVIAYFFDVPLRDAMHRNNQRKLQKKIPPVAVAGTHKKLEAPSKNEGFDQIFAVQVTEPAGFVVKEAA
jgi:predicted kinase